MAQIGKRVHAGRWDGLLSWAREQCRRSAGADLAERIAAVDLGPYTSKLVKGLRTAYRRAEKENWRALYFEYDLDNDWRSAFLLYSEYTARRQGDDTWAQRWNDSIDGPGQRSLGALYRKTGFDDSPAALGGTPFLIARTAAAFHDAFEQAGPPPAGLSICFGFHDQDDIWRVHEPPARPRARATAPRGLPVSTSARLVELFSPSFDRLHHLTEGRAAAQKDGRWGYVDGQGTTVLPFSFDEARAFHEGLAAVRKGRAWGWIDATGQWAIAPELEAAGSFVQGGAPAKRNGSWGVVDRSGRWLHEPAFPLLVQPWSPDDCPCASHAEPLPSTTPEVWLVWDTAGAVGLLSSSGQMLARPQWQASNVGRFSEGLLSMVLEKRLCWVDARGVVSLERAVKRADRSHAGPFRDGMAAVLHDGEALFVDRAGRTVVRGGIECRDFSEGLGYIRLERRKGAGFVDATGAFIVKEGGGLEFTQAGFSEGLASALSRKTRDTCFVDRAGRVALRLPFGFGDFHGGAAVVASEHRCAYVDRDGGLLCPFQYEEASNLRGGMAIVKRDGRYAFAHVQAAS